MIAVLADRLWWGNIAKSLIFMPMAISFVGASVIWKFVYTYRGPGIEQIGVLNAIVTGLGFPPQAWITIPVLNSVLLMIILIWIQTGFAMVILSAALRGIPEETLEAARIDGANDFRIFFDIMIPQIWGTLVVVWTTITITVLKVFDIVYAMTNGEFQTQVLANLMYRWMFISGRLRARLDHRGDHHAGGGSDHGLEHPSRQCRTGDTLMTAIDRQQTCRRRRLSQAACRGSTSASSPRTWRCCSWSRSGPFRQSGCWSARCATRTNWPCRAGGRR